MMMNNILRVTHYISCTYSTIINVLMYACLRRNKKPVCCTRYFLLSTHSFIQHATCKSMSQYIIKRSVRSKTDHDFKHTDASTSKYTIANTLVSAESTYYTLQLPTVKCPRRTMTIQISFKVCSSPNESKYSP